MSSTASDKTASLKPKKVVIPKVWKRPHSTIYGKNVEFGSKLYSDKLGEINGRKFNSELPWQIRNSGGTSSTSGSSTSQGYLSKLLNEPQSTLIGSVITSRPSPAARLTSSSLHEQAARERRLTPDSCANYADVLELTNPNRYSKRRASYASARDRNAGRPRVVHDSRQAAATAAAATTTNKPRRIDFYEDFLDDFNHEIQRMNGSSRLLNDPLMQRRAFDKHLDFNYELGLFVPTGGGGGSSSMGDDGRSLMRKKTLGESWRPNEPLSSHASFHGANLTSSSSSSSGTRGDDTPRPTGVGKQQQSSLGHNHNQRRPSYEHETDINPAHFNPVITTTKQTQLLPKHACQLADSPYGQSADGRKLSLGSINPHSYRPSLPHKTTTVHASDGEEFEFQDKSSPFYTDRWAGRTIRHFDSDLYSNANLFKSMIL